MRIWNRRNLLLAFSLIAVVATALSGVAAQEVAAGPPFSKGDVLYLLRNDMPSKKVSEYVRKRGITFQVTPDVEKQLRAAGADSELLAALRASAPNQARVAMSSPGSGDLSEAIALNREELLQLARKTDRDYFEFRLDRQGARVTLGALQLQFVETDLGHKLFTVNLYFDGKVSQRRNEAVDDPVFFYMQGAATALELVVNKIAMNSVGGYISAPKDFLRGATNVLSEETAHGQKHSALTAPPTPEEYCRRGDAFLAGFEWDKAIRQYQAALRLKPDFAEAKRKLAEALKYKENASQR